MLVHDHLCPAILFIHDQITERSEQEAGAARQGVEGPVAEAVGAVQHLQSSGGGATGQHHE